MNDSNINTSQTSKATGIEEGSVTNRSNNNNNNNSNNNPNQLLTTILFGLLNQFDDRYVIDNSKAIDSSKKSSSLKNEKITDTDLLDVERDANSIVPENGAVPAITTTTATTNDKNIEGILDQIDRWIPQHDDSNIKLKKTTIYKGALQLLQEQRDSYLVGTEYAEWRKNDRIRQQNYYQRYYRRYRTMHRGETTRSTTATTLDSYNIPYNPTTISHTHIASIASDFIPTPTVQNLLTPILTNLFDKDTGILYGPIKQSTIDIITSQQQNLQITMKQQILHLLDNPRNRDAMKNSTQGIIITKTDRIVNGTTS